MTTTIHTQGMPIAARTAPAWASAQLALRAELASWITQASNEQRARPWQGGHDEGSFASSWAGYVLLTGDETAHSFLDWLSESCLDWMDDHFYHGYAAEGEVHHATETFVYFLPRVWSITSDHQRVVAALEHAAHHTGNWEPAVPPWYDWDTHRFRSYYLASRVVRTGAAHDWNVPDHFKVIQMALCAWEMGGQHQSRYLDLACDYADAWAEPILAGNGVPSLLLPPGKSVTERLLQDSPIVRRVALLREVAAVELHVAAGSIDVYLDLYAITGRERYREAAAALLAPVLPVVAAPRADVAAALFAKFRRITGDDRFDASLRDRLDGVRQIADDEDLADLVLLLAEPAPRKSPIAATGSIGERFDQVLWGFRRDDRIEYERGPSPAALLLAYALWGDETAAARAFAKGAARLRLARRSLEDGRRHGCSGNTVSAVARGNGRAGSIGVVTGTLYPATMGSYQYLNHDCPLVRYSGADDALGLPEGVAALVSSDLDGTLRVLLAAPPDTRGQASVRLAGDVTIPAGREAAPEVTHRVTVQAEGHPPQTVSVPADGCVTATF